MLERRHKLADTNLAVLPSEPPGSCHPTRSFPQWPLGVRVGHLRSIYYCLSLPVKLCSILSPIWPLTHSAIPVSSHSLIMPLCIDSPPPPPSFLQLPGDRSIQASAYPLSTPSALTCFLGSPSLRVPWQVRESRPSSCSCPPSHPPPFCAHQVGGRGGSRGVSDRANRINCVWTGLRVHHVTLHCLTH